MKLAIHFVSSIAALTKLPFDSDQRSGRIFLLAESDGAMQRTSIRDLCP